jgi:hypothetical protein
MAYPVTTTAGGGMWMGSTVPWMVSAGLSMGFFCFFVFYLINRGRHLKRLGKGLMYGDL